MYTYLYLHLNLGISPCDSERLESNISFDIRDRNKDQESAGVNNWQLKSR